MYWVTKQVKLVSLYTSIAHAIDNVLLPQKRYNNVITSAKI